MRFMGSRPVLSHQERAHGIAPDARGNTIRWLESDGKASFRAPRATLARMR
jgi:hypothetical protein